MHGTNANGTCGIVAIQILLGYYDTFSNDHIIEENYDIVSENYTDKINLFSQSPSTNNDFHNELIRFAKEKNISENSIGMNISQEKDLIVEYLKSRNIDFTYKWVEGNWSDDINNSCLNHIKEAINNDRPIFVGACKHATVAYAYDDDFVYVHSGWGMILKTPWSTFNTNIVSFENNPHSVDITKINTEHWHSDNYFSSMLDQYICPCDYHTDHLIVNPEDYGFENQYFFYDKSLDITIGKYTFNTKRLRTGYIEKEKINLSPIRENAGTAYLEYRFDTIYLRKIKVDLSLWSSSEKIYTYGTSLLLQYLDPIDNVYVTAFDFLHETLLGIDRYNQDKYIVDFPYGTQVFRFYSTSKAIGTRNKGRLSIGGMEIICHDI